MRIILLLLLEWSFDNSGIAEDIGRQLLVYGRRISPAEFVKRLDQIDHCNDGYFLGVVYDLVENRFDCLGILRLSGHDSDEVRRVAQKHLMGKPVTMTGVGMVQNVMQLSEVQKLAQWSAAAGARTAAAGSRH